MLNFTTLCKVYSNAISTNCFVSFFTISMSFLNDMLGNHARSFSTENTSEIPKKSDTCKLLTYQKGGNNDCDVGTQNRYMGCLHLHHRLEEFIIRMRWLIIIICTVKNDRSIVSQHSVKSCPSLHSR